MLTYTKLVTKPEKVLRFTSLTKEQFENIASSIAPLWEVAEVKRLSRNDRKRRIGGGRPYKLKTIEDKLLLALMYYRLYVNYDLLEILFNLENSQIYRLLIKLEPLIEKAVDPYLFGRLKRINNNIERIKTIEEFIKKFPDLKEIIIDATEQRRLKPQNKSKEAKSFSGKRKYHTLKTQIIINSRGKILAVSKTVGGRTNDTTLLRESTEFKHLPEELDKYMDLGYEGIKTKDKVPKTILPNKRFYDQKLKVTIPLTKEEKEENKLHSKVRIVVENTLARVKKYNILGQTYRNKEKRYNQIFRNISALVNYILECRLAVI